MALAGKKSGNMHNLSGSKKAELQSKFDEDFHDAIILDPDSNPMLASILYTVQNLTEDIDSLRSFTDSELKGLINSNTSKETFPGIGTTSSKCKAGNTTTISNTQSNAITANTAKSSYDKNLSNTKAIESGAVDVKMTVTESRGAYALVFTMTHGRVTKTATIALR